MIMLLHSRDQPEECFAFTIVGHTFKSAASSFQACCTSKSKGKGGRGRVQGKGEGPRDNWEKVQVLRICRGVVVAPSRVIRDEYRI